MFEIVYYTFWISQLSEIKKLQSYNIRERNNMNHSLERCISSIRMMGESQWFGPNSLLDGSTIFGFMVVAACVLVYRNLTQ